MGFVWAFCDLILQGQKWKKILLFCVCWYNHHSQWRKCSGNPTMTWPSEKDAKRKLFRNVFSLTSFYFHRWKLFWNSLCSQTIDLDWYLFKTILKWQYWSLLARLMEQKSSWKLLLSALFFKKLLSTSLPLFFLVCLWLSRKICVTSFPTPSPLINQLNSQLVEFGMFSC